MNPRIVSITTYLAIFITIWDQLTKRIATQSLPVSGGVPVTSFLNLNLTVNHGVDFYLFGQNFSGLATHFFIAFWLVIFFAFNRWRLHTISTLAGVGIGLVMGGVIGNLVDRLRFGTVVDFLDFHIGNFHLYTLNFAECSTVLGIILLMLDAALKERQREQTSPPSETEHK